MSQHTFATTYKGRPVSLFMGWDRPLQGFFMVVTRDDARECKHELVYSNLEDLLLIEFGGLPPVLDPFRDRLALLGIEAPARMIEEIERDALANVGNRHVSYDAEGRAAGKR